LTGVSREILRVWERERLISPRRTPGGHRLYSGDDLQRLREIARMRRMDQFNAAAIRRELGPADGAASRPEPGTSSDLGARLRALRTGRGWSLADVAATCGLSVSFLSAVERGQSSISVGNLFKLADAYGTTVPGLNPDYRSDHGRVLRPQDRPRYVAAQGRVVIEDLITRPGTLEAQRIVIHPGGGSEEPYTHPGEELIHVLAGALTFWLDETERYALGEGDTLFFRSTRLHRWWNEGETTTTVLWINVPIVDATGDGSGERASARWRGADRTGGDDGDGGDGGNDVG
ncbi:MAG: cupin domain-containing protein, partial [Chloroflexota bacterium]|nr:cupin domain-containing protein [Chloroflexota bacterium]